MILNNIKQKRDRGFTIVELLVVIVVIGILAAITIVSYTGITNKANTTKALSNAQAVQTVAETIAADNASAYPATAAAFATGSTTTKLPAGISVIPGLPGVGGVFTGTDPLIALDAATKLKTVTWACSSVAAVSPSCSNLNGGRITFWDFTTPGQSSTVIYVGAATATSNFYAPAS